MSETFKINMYFDEKGEELEGLIKHLIINIYFIHRKFKNYHTVSSQ